MKHYFALSLLLISVLATADHVDKRDTVWITKYTEVVETTYETATVWVPFPTNGPDNTAGPQAEPSFVAPAPAASNDDSTNDQSGTNESPEPSVAPVPEAPTSVVPAPAQVSTSATPSQGRAPVSPSQAPAQAPSPQPPQGNSGDKQTPSASSSGGSGQTYTGEMTYYDPGMGSCGITSSSNEPIVAISHILMDPKNPGNPNANPLCGKTINITYHGKTTQAKIVDRCVSCAEGDLDMSSSLFQTVAGDLGQGRVSGMTWSYAN